MLVNVNCALFAACFMLVCYLTYPSTLMMKVKCSSGTSVDVLDCVVLHSRNMGLFVATAVRTSNPKIVVNRFFSSKAYNYNKKLPDIFSISYLWADTERVYMCTTCVSKT
jgi:hypothetical protein